MNNILLTALLALLLSACSAKTRYTLSVDLASFLTPTQKSNTVNFSGFGAVTFPDPPASVPLPSLNLKAVEKAGVEATLSLSNNNATPITLSYELFIAPASDPTLGDGQGGEFKISSQTVNLTANETNKAITALIELSQSQNNGAYNLIAQGGNIKFAIKLSSSAAINVTYTVNAAKLGITVRPLGFLQ